MVCCVFCGERISSEAKFCCNHCGRPFSLLATHAPIKKLIKK